MTILLASRAAARASRPAVSSCAPILAAKTTAPGVPDWAVPRPRITELIDQGRRWCPLTVITAPAGAGKTMALALWAATGSGLVTWVGLDEFDNRPGVFWPMSWRRCAGPAWLCRRSRLPGGAGRRARIRAGTGGAGGSGPAADAGPG